MKRKNHHAVALGKRGGHARAKNLSAEQLSQIGRNAVLARIRKYGQKIKSTKKTISIPISLDSDSQSEVS